MNQTTVLNPPTAGREHGRAGVSNFAAPSPVYAPPSPSHAFGRAQTTSRPNHRTAIIGASALALVAAGLVGAAYIRTQEAATATSARAAVAAAVVQVPRSVYDSQVPALAQFAPIIPASVYAQQVPTGHFAVDTAVIPHAALAADLAVAARASELVPASVYAQQVPQAADPIVPASVYAQQVPAAAR